MNLLVYLEERYVKTSGGIYASTLGVGVDFWVRYLVAFSNVYIVARVQVVDEIPVGAVVISHPNIKFVDIPSFQGAYQFVGTLFSVVLSIFKATGREGQSLLRLPGLNGTLAYFFLRFRRKSFAVELVGDPYDVFGNGGVGGRFSFIFRVFFTFITRLACKEALGVAYVTKSAMQLRYPVGNKGVEFYYSSIQLPGDLIVEQPRQTLGRGGSFSIVMIGSMEQMYKGFDVMIDALQALSDLNIRVFIAGDGRYRETLVQRAIKMNVYDKISFLGKISRADVINALDGADLFVMPSRTEGLPRALIEAMARGVPAIGAAVGGIPELLKSEYLFRSEDSSGLAQLVRRLINSPDELERMAFENIIVAKEYRLDVLQVRQSKFYSFLAQESSRL